MINTRKLAAILAADVAGYSRLVGLDEEGTIARLQALRCELIGPAIAKHHGRIFKTTGDGLLVEFASVVDAVRCAVEVQRSMAERNSDVNVERRIEFRVGVNLGDVMVQDEDLVGDGINVAARLESLSEPGGMCLSEDAYRHVRDRLNLKCVDGGEQRLKNIARPIRIFRVSLSGASAAPPSSQDGADTANLSSVRWSMVVLPFTTIGSNSRWMNPGKEREIRGARAAA